MKTRPAKPIPIHELDGVNRHRIVLPSADGTCIASDWVPVTEIANLGNLYAACADSALPPGIFTLNEKPHQVLAA